MRKITNLKKWNNLFYFMRIKDETVKTTIKTFQKNDEPRFCKKKFIVEENHEGKKTDHKHSIHSSLKSQPLCA